MSHEPLLNLLQGENEFLGATTTTPRVRLSLDTPVPRLDWYPIDRYRTYAGELLSAFELLLVSHHHSFVCNLIPTTWTDTRVGTSRSQTFPGF